jgi:hypothetical protein
VTEWQDYLARELARIVRETDCDVIYLDSVGMRSERCWNAQHARYHRPGDGWYQGVGEMLRKVRAAIKAVKPDCALLTEHPSCDVNTQFLDGSLSYSVHGAEDLLRDAGIPLNPTGTTLFRFLFPEFKLLELPRGHGSNLTGYKLGFFNGNATWNAFATPEAKLVLTPLSRAFHENRDAFTTAHPMPLIPTLHPAVHANKFPARNKVLYTLFNLSDQPVDGPLLEVHCKPKDRFAELLTGRPIRAEVKGQRAQLSGRIEPKEVLCLGAFPPTSTRSNR